MAPGGARATTAVTLGGRTVDPGGAIDAPKPAAVTRANGVFDVAVPRGSVALLTLSRSQAVGGWRGRAVAAALSALPCGQLRAVSARGRSAATSSHGRVLTTASALSHPRRAVAIP